MVERHGQASDGNDGETIISPARAAFLPIGAAEDDGP